MCTHSFTHACDVHALWRIISSDSSMPPLPRWTYSTTLLQGQTHLNTSLSLIHSHTHSHTSKSRTSFIVEIDMLLIMLSSTNLFFFTLGCLLCSLRETLLMFCVRLILSVCNLFEQQQPLLWNLYLNLIWHSRKHDSFLQACARWFIWVNCMSQM